MNDESDNFEIINPDSLIKNPGVSVVMSVYNGERYLKESIESVLSQTYNNFEFIIINDGSTDGTPGILKEYLRKDNRILIINQENIGLTKSLNRGIRLSRGEFIARQDADDVSYPKRLEKQMEWFSDSEDRVLCGTNAGIIGDNVEFSYVKQCFQTESDILKALLINNPFFHTSTMFTRDAWDKVSGYREFFKYSQDYDLYARLSRLGRIGILKEPLVAFRKNREGISKKKALIQHEYGALAAVLFYATKKYPQGKFSLGFSSFHPDCNINRDLKNRYDALLNYYMLCIGKEPLCPRWRLIKYGFKLKRVNIILLVVLYAFTGYKIYNYLSSFMKSCSYRFRYE